MAYIKGNFRKYIFKSDKGFVVGLFKVRDCSIELEQLNNKTITFTGYFGDLNETDLYVLNGKLTNHDRYGEQFLCDSYEITLPNNKENIVEFLSSNLFPGIGESKASTIVNVLGDNCLDVIINNPDSLFLVPKITKKQKDTISLNLIKYQQSYKTIVSLSKYGFTTKDALTIYNNYKDETLDVINDNIYNLIDDIYDITFKKIEMVRHNFNITEKDERRIKSGIKYFMNEASYSLGNTYFNLDEIVYYTKKGLFLYDEELIFRCLNDLVNEGEIIVIDDKYFLSKTYEAEYEVANRIFNLANLDTFKKVSDEDIEKLENYFKITYNEDQKTAMKKALQNNFLVITGGPGTGKTTIIKAICKLYQDINGYSNNDLTSSLALLAPTGRAAKRISEQTLLPAYTIHRFLKWNKEDNTFNINKDNKSDVKLIIVDESSMIDIYLLNSLFEGIYPNCKIILIGDYNQLPSVGPGQVLKDIVDSSCVDVIKLNKLYRQKETSNINILAHNINNNIFDMSIFNESEDLTFVKCNNSNIKEYIKEYSLTYKDLGLNEFIVLAPIYKNDNGIDDLNYFMQDLLNKNSNSIIANGIPIKENDKVLQLVNMVDENIFNGDIGKVLKINKDKNKEIIIDYDSNIVRFTPSSFSNFTLGYTISIHKSQGSEFEVVVIPVLNKYSNMLYKKLIYTAITRAKKKLIILGEEDALKKAIFTDKENNRKTSLNYFINSCIK